MKFLMQINENVISLEKNIKELINIKYKIRFEESVILYIYE